MSGIIVTMAHGAKHLALWDRYCRENWLAYAGRHGLDLLVLDRLIDDSDFGGSRSATWQKLLLGRVAALARYDRVAWVDSDIVINPALAPNVFTGIPPGKIGAVAASVLFENPLFAGAFREICGASHRTIRDYYMGIYERNGLSPLGGQYVNGGVLAFATRDWGWMEELYYRCQPLPKSFEEQTFLSHEIVRRNLLFLLDPRFNVEWYPFKYSVYDFASDNPELTRLCIRQLLKQSYFLHFNGNHADILCCDAASQYSASADDRSVEESR